MLDNALADEADDIDVTEVTEATIANSAWVLFLVTELARLSDASRPCVQGHFAAH